MNEQRKTVYKIRQQLLLGIYTPEILDEEGKATGKVRTIEPLERLAGRREAGDRRTCSSTTARRCRSRAKRSSARRRSRRSKRSSTWSSSGTDIYQFWGYRFDFKEAEAKEPQKVYDRLMEEIPSSLTQQRERLLDLVDGIVARDRRGELPARTSRRRTGTGRASGPRSSSTSAASPTSSSTSTIRPISRMQLYTQCADDRSKSARRRWAPSCSCASSATSISRTSTSSGSSTSRTWSTSATASVCAATASAIRSRSTRRRATTSS